MIGQLARVTEDEGFYLMTDGSRYAFSREALFRMEYGNTAKVHAGPSPLRGTGWPRPIAEREFSQADLLRGRRVWGDFERITKEMERPRKT